MMLFTIYLIKGKRMDEISWTFQYWCNLKPVEVNVKKKRCYTCPMPLKLTQYTVKYRMLWNSIYMLSLISYSIGWWDWENSVPQVHAIYDVKSRELLHPQEKTSRGKLTFWLFFQDYISSQPVSYTEPGSKHIYAGRMEDFFSFFFLSTPLLMTEKIMSPP